MIKPKPLIVATALSVGNLFLHKPISDVFDTLFSRVGRRWYEIICLGLIGALCAAAAAPSLRRLSAALQQTWLPVSLLGLTVLTLASHRWLLVTNVELIHFPQFALIAVLFLSAGVAPKLAWLGGSLAGLLDETYQHFVLYAGVPNTYFDINDILLNTIGAAWGVCLFGAGGLSNAGPTFAKTRSYALFAAVAVSVTAAALYFDPPDQVWLRPAATRRLYRVLSWGEGLAGIFAVTALVELAATPRKRGRSGGTSANTAGSSAND